MGRIWSPGKYVARPEWYDRNPATRSIGYVGVGLGPHSPTSRGSYTVPSGKKAKLENMFVMVARSGAATTAGPCWGYIEYTPSGGSAKRIIPVLFVNNTLYYNERAVVGESGVLLEGDKVEMFTADISTGGMVDYYLSIKITEFDA